MSRGRSIFKWDNNNVNARHKIQVGDNYRCESKNLRIKIKEDESNKPVFANYAVFSVTLNILTDNYDFIKFAEKFKDGSIDGVDFQIKNEHMLEISVKNNLTKSQENSDLNLSSEKMFRAAIGCASKSNLTTKNLAAILDEYAQHLKYYNLKSNCSSQKGNEDHYSPTPHGNFSF